MTYRYQQMSWLKASGAKTSAVYLYFGFLLSLECVTLTLTLFKICRCFNSKYLTVF